MLEAVGAGGAIIAPAANCALIDLGAAAIRTLGVPGAAVLHEVKSALPAAEMDGRFWPELTKTGLKALTRRK